MSARPAIVLVTTSFPRSGDGSEAAGGFVADLAEELARRQPVRVVAPGPRNASEQRGPGIEVFRYAAPERALSTLKPWNPADLVSMVRVLRAGREATRRAVAAGPVTQVLALWALPSGAWARTAAREAGVPYSVWTLGSDIWSLGRIPLVRGWLRDVLGSAETCYSDGLRLADDTRRIAGREVQFLPSTRRIDGRRPLPLRLQPPYRLLFLGRWHPNKGVDLLLDALSALADDDWQRIERVHICGGGSLANEVRAKAAKLADKGRPVAVFGYLDKPAAEAQIADADWLLVPSRIESIPVVISDAAKLGCAILASPVGDLPELVAGPPAAGLVAAAVSADAFAAAISRALRRPPAEFADGLSDLAARFDLGTIAGRIIAGHREAE